ncbi:MAG: A24 family peptidase [Nanoarchaeota archaeon]|nr:A24 family peptidase [Nanoarchaeota archaeon]
MIELWLWGGIALLLASINDLRTREVPDWLSYSLFALALGYRIFASLIMHDGNILLSGLLGGGIFFVIAVFMFYTGQWGGGDSKLLIGLGTLFGFQMGWQNDLVAFVINFLFIGAMYGLIWTFVLALKNRERLAKEFKIKMQDKRLITAKWVLLLTAALLIAATALLSSPWLLPIAMTVALVIITMYMWIIVKAVEKTCMLKWLPTSKLTEGDWIAEDIIVKGKKVAGIKDLGITKRQIAELTRKKVKKVLVKEGIPFVPSFFLSYVFTLAWGNVFFFIL